MNIDDIKGVRRTYESFDIVWEDGARWTNYESLERAMDTATADFISGRKASHIVRRSWTVDIPNRLLGIYNSGCAGDEALTELEFSHPMQSATNDERIELERKTR